MFRLLSSVIVCMLTMSFGGCSLHIRPSDARFRENQLVATSELGVITMNWPTDSPWRQVRIKCVEPGFENLSMVLCLGEQSGMSWSGWCHDTTMSGEKFINGDKGWEIGIRVEEYFEDYTNTEELLFALNLQIEEAKVCQRLIVFGEQGVLVTATESLVPDQGDCTKWVGVTVRHYYLNGVKPSPAFFKPFQVGELKLTLTNPDEVIQ